MNFINKIMLLTYALLIISCNNSVHTIRNTFEETLQLKSILKTGRFKVKYISKNILTINQGNLLNKFKYLLVKNKTTQEYIKNANPNNLVYNSKIGLTKKEFNELLKIFDSKSIYDSGYLTIKNIRDTIKFYGDNKLNILDSLNLSSSFKFAKFKSNFLERVSDSIPNINCDLIPANETLDSIIYFQSSVGILNLIPINYKHVLLLAKLKPSGKFFLYFYSNESNVYNYYLPNSLYIIWK